MKHLLTLALVLVSSLTYALTPETIVQAKLSVTKGTTYLRSVQAENGSVSDARFPGITGLALWAFTASKDPACAQAADKAAAFILSTAQPDGGFYIPIPGRKGSGLGNYNTCLCVTALYDADKVKYLQPILKARGYIASSQLHAEGIHEGGFGYDKASNRAYTDLNNSFYAVDAMTRTASVEEMRPVSEKRVDIDWKAAEAYIISLQSDEGEDKGGFFYDKEHPKAGVKDATSEAEKPKFRAYGSMTYAGLLSMLHCKLTKSDPKVRSALDYVTKYWTLEENPNMGAQGLYFYYNVLTRALNATGLDTIPTQPKPTAWKEEMAKKIIAIQRENGSWFNDNNRFWEADPVLATSYAVITLELLLAE